MKIIFGGHWGSAPEGWTALTERQQDITHRLAYDDASVDAIFTEHVIEHIPMWAGIGFMHEALRVLKPGGIFRVVAPMVETLSAFKQDHLGVMYAQQTLPPYYQAEAQALQKLGLSLEVDPHPFLMDSLLKKHGHQFCWSQKLMVAVLLKVGFQDARPASPGVSAYDKSSCLERTIRGIHAENAVREFGEFVYDPESGVVEARK